LPLFIGVLLNNWKIFSVASLAIALLSWVALLEVKALHYRDAAHTAQVELQKRIDADKAQELKNATEAKAHALQDTEIAAQLSSALSAAHLTGVALTDSVLKYETAGRCSVPGHGSAAGAPRSDSSGQAASGAGSVKKELAIIPADAQVIVDQLKACQAALKGMGAQ
jgi:hypothetical protein